MNISSELGRNNLEAMLKRTQKDFGNKQKKFDKLGSYITLLKGRSPEQIKELASFLSAMQECGECAYSNDISARNNPSEFLCDILNQAGEGTSTRNHSRWHVFRTLSEPDKKIADLKWRLPYRQEGQECVLIRMDEEELGEMTESLVEQTNQVKQELKTLESRVNKIQTSLERAEPKPCFPQFRPRDYSVGGEAGIIYSNEVFIKTRLSGISCDGYLGAKNTRFHRRWDSPQIMLEWEFEYLKEHEGFRGAWLEFAEQTRHSESFEQFKKSLIEASVRGERA